MNIRFFESARLLFAIGGAVLAFMGERYFAGSTKHWILTGAGIGFMFLGVLAALMCLRFARREGFRNELPSWRLSIVWQLQLVASFVFYLAYVKFMGGRPEPDSLLTKGLLVLWFGLFVIGFFMGIGTEWAKFNNGRGPFAEPQRVRLATYSWLKVGILSIMIASLNYTAVRKNITWDLSYLKTTQPSPSTLKMVEDVGQDVEVALFFPTGNEVLSKARLYFDSIKDRSSRLAVSYFDMETNPLAAERFKTSRNGFVVLKSGDLTERFDLGVTIAAARKGLKNLDADFQKALLGVLQKKRTIYFTRGHGELSWMGDDQTAGGLKSIKLLEGYLRSLNFNMHFLGVSDGAGREVPSDADAVVIIGGDQPFLPEEARSLQRYVENGGKLLVMLDVDMPMETSIAQGVRDATKDPIVSWLKEIGIEYHADVLANATNHIAATRTEADVWFIYSNVFTSQESVQALARNEQRAALLLFRSGYFSTKQDVADWRVFDTVRSLSDTFVDENRDFKFNERAERREPRVLGAAAEQSNHTPASKDGVKKLGRVLTFADASAVSDALIRNQANLVYFVDGLRWLMGDPAASGVAASEEDVRIRHTNNEDVAWFYGAIVIVPGLVLLAGRFATARARRSRGRVSVESAGKDADQSAGGRV